MADTTYRTGFGTGAFGVRAYGVDGVLKDGEAIVIGVTSTAAANVRVRLSGSIIASSSSNTSDATRVREVSASASVSASSTSAVQRVRESASDISASATSAASVERVREQSATSSIAASNSGNKNVDITLSESSPNITTSPRITPREIRRVMMIRNSGNTRITGNFSSTGFRL